MKEFEARLFADDAAIIRLGEGLMGCKLPREEWTHEAHLAVCLWMLRTRPDIALEPDLPHFIRRYNESVGVVNDDHQGYHETLTQLYIATVRAHHRKTAELPLINAINSLLAGESGRRGWPFRFYSRNLLFSVAARRKFVEPDILPLSEMAAFG